LASGSHVPDARCFVRDERVPKKERGIIAKQVAALPFRLDPDGRLEVLLVTSRGRRRWLPPKGNIEPGRSEQASAALEAFEEAGVVGIVDDHALGVFHWVKSRRKGKTTTIAVTLYPLEVERCEPDWPEKGQRKSAWFTPRAAAAAVSEPGLAQLLENFAP
jgi:8-oxo-dGTP pyrophosphatase MutT (NUDIX family)